LEIDRLFETTRHGRRVSRKKRVNGRLKGDFVSIKLPSGDIEIRTPGGFVVCPVEIRAKS
jgi:hypothetical protein